jgi:hypothetical protein
VDERQIHPLKALRRTCKQLEALCNPVFAKRISIYPWYLPALERRKVLASKFAKYLKEIGFSIWLHQGENELFMESVLTAILDRTVHLRRIALGHFTTDTMAHSQVLNAIGKLSVLEDVNISDLDYPASLPPYGTVQSTFHHRLLNHILDCHSQRLRALVVCSRTPMHESTLLKLRDTASQLRHLEFRWCLTTETRDTFTVPRIWACAGRLEYLGFWKCAIHPATIARHIGAGVFGPVRRFHIAMCRDKSHDPTEPVATIWAIPPLTKVQVEYFSDWEMDKLRSIHAEKVYIKMYRDWSDRRPFIEAFSQSTTFPQVTELHVQKDWDDKDFEELRRSCAMRGLTKVERDIVRLVFEE